MISQMIQKVGTLPGVVTAASIDTIPLSGPSKISSTTPYGGIKQDEKIAEYRLTSGNYFRTMGIPLIDGRVFLDGDRGAHPPVAVVNETLAKLMWGGENAIGKRFKRAQAHQAGQWYTVIGVVGDVRNHALSQAPLPQVYLAEVYPWTTIVLQSLRDPLSLVPEVQAAIWAVNGTVPISSVATMDEVIGNSLSRQKFSLLLAVLLASISFSLSLFGVFSVVSYTITQQSHSIGIRLAVGATDLQVLWVYVRRTLGVVLIGLVLGVGLFSLLGKRLQELLYGVGMWDGFTITLVCIGILSCSAVACWCTLRSILAAGGSCLIR